MKPLVPLLLLALGAATAAYADDDVYRSLMPNGNIVYGESPAPGAKSVKKVPRPPSGISIVTPEDRARASRIQPETGGVAVIPQKQRPSPPGAIAGSSPTGATYGQSPGALPKHDY